MENDLPMPPTITDAHTIGPSNLASRNISYRWTGTCAKQQMPRLFTAALFVLLNYGNYVSRRLASSVLLLHSLDYCTAEK